MVFQVIRQIGQYLGSAVACSICASCLLSFGPYSSRSAQAGDEFITRTMIVDLLRHRERLVGSMRCVYEVDFQPTSPDMIPLINELGRKNPALPPNRFIASPDVRERSYSAEWWRKGIKERREERQGLKSARQAEVLPSVIEVFDGEVVKALADGGEQPFGVVGNAKTEHWYQANTVQPFSLLYEFARRPYSELIAESPEFQAERARRGGTRSVEVSFRDPRTPDHLFILVFDEKYRLLERRFITKYSDSKRPRLGEIHKFSGYQPFSDRSGEIIWFPRQAVYHYYMGHTTDGIPIEYDSRIVRILQVDFNVDIPDEKFQLDFPQDTLVFDKLNNLGPLGQSMAPERSFSAGGRWRIVVAIVAAAFLAVLAFLLLKAQTRRRLGPNEDHPEATSFRT